MSTFDELLIAFEHLSFHQDVWTRSSERRHSKIKSLLIPNVSVPFEEHSSCPKPLADFMKKVRVAKENVEDFVLQP
jgi:hypothetical protein